MCDIYAPIRPGTDIAFLGGLINYVLQNEEYFEEYVKVYTNAATIITEDFEDADASACSPAGTKTANSTTLRAGVTRDTP